MVQELDLSVQIEISPGVWLELEDADNGYEIGAGSFATRDITFKQRTVGDEVLWLSGELTVASAPHNVVEPLEVWVNGETHFEFDTKMTAVQNALSQLGYRVKRTIGDSRITWSCQAVSQLSIDTKQEYLFATTGLLTAQVPHLPDVLLEQVA